MLQPENTWGAVLQFGLGDYFFCTDFVYFCKSDSDQLTNQSPVSGPVSPSDSPCCRILRRMKTVWSFLSLLSSPLSPCCPVLRLLASVSFCLFWFSAARAELMLTPDANSALTVTSVSAGSSSEPVRRGRLGPGLDRVSTGTDSVPDRTLARTDEG